MFGLLTHACGSKIAVFLRVYQASQGDKHHRPYKSDKNAVQIEAGYAGRSENIHYEAADKGADNAKDDIDEYAVPRFHENGSKPSGNASQKKK